MIVPSVGRKQKIRISQTRKTRNCTPYKQLRAKEFFFRYLFFSIEYIKLNIDSIHNDIIGTL